MDSLKVPPKGTSKPTSGSTPITVRFNAGDESIDELFHSFTSSGGGDSLSSSPHQNVEENPRNTNFLQGNFFNNRRRSGSIEGSPSGSIGGDSNSIGTWKLFKGRVSQAMGDIKSSTKTSNLPTPKSETSCGDIDSDAENVTINSSISDELSLDQEIKMLIKQQKDDSDSDVEPDILSNDDIETSTIRKSFANLRSKVSNKSATVNSTTTTATTPQQIQTQQLPPPHQNEFHNGNNENYENCNINLSNDFNNRTVSSSAAPAPAPAPPPPPTTNSNSKSDLSPVARASLSIRNSLLRNRKANQNLAPTQTQTQTQTQTPTPTPTPTQIQTSETPQIPITQTSELTKRLQPKKKYIEIESGVEMMEDTDVNTNTTNKESSQSDSNKSNAIRNQLGAAAAATPPPPNRNKKNLNIFKSSCCCPQTTSSTILLNSFNYNDSLDLTQSAASTQRNLLRLQIKTIGLKAMNLIIAEFPYITLIICIFLLTVFDLPDFYRGVIACVVTFSIINKTTIVINKLFQYFGGPEKVEFAVPDYSRMPILEIPPIEEYQITKNYSGWMNTINHYDPDEFKMSLTNSIYIKLEGSVITLSETLDRIPKRQMWNEKVIDRKSIQFTQHRTFNMLGCRVELRPRGLAKKRYFNRKYPIQLILKNDFHDREEVDRQSSIEEIQPIRPKSFKKIYSESVGFTVIDHEKNDEKSNVKEAPEFRRRKGLNTELTETQQTTKESPNVVIDHPSTMHHEQKIGFNKKSIGNELNAKPSEGSINEMMSINNLICTEIDFVKPIELKAEIALAREECPDLEIYESDIPFADETQIWLFARCDRQKEDWYRRFLNASKGFVQDHDVHLPNVIIVDDDLIEAATKTQSPSKSDLKNRGNMQPDEELLNDSPKQQDNKDVSNENNEHFVNVDINNKEIPPGDKATDSEERFIASSMFPEEYSTQFRKDLGIEGLIVSNSAGRNPVDYINFMSIFQNACTQSKIPVSSTIGSNQTEPFKKQQRSRRPDGDLWKGVNQSLFLGPSGSVVWFNVLAGRFIYSCLHDEKVLNFLQILLQKKVSALKLPNFMEDVVISNINMGDKPPLIHRVSQPMLDERGIWIDADVTYEGLIHMTVTAKMNLMRLKRGSEPTAPLANTPPNDEKLPEGPITSTEILFDSDAESDGGSSDEDDIEHQDEQKVNNVASKKGEGKAKRIFKFVDRIATSNLFQLAAELPVVQKAMEKASTNITLRVELKGLVGRLVLNIPPPPSDRIWISFRAPPRLWLSATPALGDLKVDWSIVTSIIENRLCAELAKFLVYPNMNDVTITLLGSPTNNQDNVT